jgi:hypothetical protein
VYDAVDGSRTYVSELRRLTSFDPMTAAMIEQLIRRKKQEFPEDHRLIGEYVLTQVNGEWRLRAEARAPRPRERTDRPI